MDVTLPKLRRRISTVLPRPILAADSDTGRIDIGASSDCSYTTLSLWNASLFWPLSSVLSRLGDVLVLPQLFLPDIAGRSHLSQRLVPIR